MTSDDTFITSCTCADFDITQRACKHMYAIEISEPELSVRLPHHSSIANVLEDDVNSNLTEETAVIINNNTSVTPVVQQTHSERIQVILRQMQHHVTDVSFSSADDQSLENIIEQLTSIQQQLNNIGNIGTNRRLQTQLSRRRRN